MTDLKIKFSTFFMTDTQCGKPCGKVAKVCGKALHNYVDSVEKRAKKVTFTKISMKTLVKATKIKNNYICLKYFYLPTQKFLNTSSTIASLALSPVNSNNA